MHARIVPTAAAVAIAIVAAFSVTAQDSDDIRAEVTGPFARVDPPSADRAAFQVTAAGLTWEVDATADKKLLDTAEKLAGGIVVIRGMYRELPAPGRVRRILSAQAIAPAPAGARGESINVNVRGTVRTDVMAIGGETTGATIKAGPVTWELVLDASHRETARRLAGNHAIVEGELRSQAGVEVPRRFIIRVRTLREGN